MAFLIRKIQNFRDEKAKVIETHLGYIKMGEISVFILFFR